MKYLSLFSGIEAVSVAWASLGWKCVGVAEVEPFPCSVLAHHYPEITNYGDVSHHEKWNITPGSVDVIVGGSPCQSFSVAGKRLGFCDPRGNLAFRYLEIVGSLRPRYCVFENVPGLLSSGGGRDFGSFLSALGQLGYGWAYRVLDAQWVRTHRHPRAVPQRRRRVFVVGCLADPRRASEILFEFQSVCRNSASRRKKGEGSPAEVAACVRSGGDGGVPSSRGEHLVVGALCARDYKGVGNQYVDEGKCVTAFDKQRIAEYGDGQTSSTCCQRDHKDATDLVVAIQGVAQLYENHPNDSRVTGPHEVSPSCVSRFGTGGGNVPFVLNQQPVPYDLFQITAPINRQNREPGDPCHTLAKDNAAHAAVVENTPYNIVFNDANGTRSDRPNGGAYINETDVTPSLTQADSDTKIVSTTVSPTITQCKGSRGGCSEEALAEISAVYEACDVYNQTIDGDVAATVTEAVGGTNTSGPKVYAFEPGIAKREGSGGRFVEDLSPTLRKEMGDNQVACADTRPSGSVRRLTPTECERLMGFPDDWTRIPYRGKSADHCPDGARYKALGNSMAVNCMEWIGERIAHYEKGSPTDGQDHQRDGTETQGSV